MPGPNSAPQGERRDPAGPKDGPHGRCQDREQCTGAGCRVSTGKTRYRREGRMTEKVRAELASIETSEQQESAA